ncbi:CCDB1-like protein [Mya arenaria]|uniref:CCDB1-like protein n=1 Tax=Mya arenaria TaxID=6604 RepID=A0ABY7EU35_MYAAR|nr:CCDB1-like protein [Mya arenaria]
MAGKNDRNIWESFIGNIDLVIQQIEGKVFKAVSHEATKLSLAYSKSPRPSNVECESLLAGVEKTLIGLVHIHSKLPKTAGLTLRKQIKQAVQQLVKEMKTLAQTIHTMDTGSPEQLQQTGMVWDGSDKFYLLPQDNKAAVSRVLDQHVPMVDDAHSELTEALNCEEDDDGLDEFLGLENSSSQNDQHWSENDKTVIQYCLGLIKCSKSLLKKARSAVSANGDCRTEMGVVQLDDLAELVERLSPTVDELASCVYPPLRCSVVAQKAADVVKANKEAILFLKQSQLTGEDDQKWVEFLRRANTHNFNKLNAALTGT